jgi:hypothetical protein
VWTKPPAIGAYHGRVVVRQYQFRACHILLLARNTLCWFLYRPSTQPTAAHDGTIGGRMRNRLSAIVVVPARAPIPAPVGATPGTPAATSGGAANGVLPSAEATGDAVDGAAAVQLGGTDSGPIDAPCPTPTDIEEPVAPIPVMPEIVGVPEPSPAAMPNGERWPSPSLPAKAPGPRKLALVTVCAICAGLKVPVDVNVFQTLAFGPQALQKLSS